MAKTREIYKCEHCGLVVESLNEVGPKPVCCGHPMILLDGKTEDAGQEKHVPVIEFDDKGITIKVGSVEHPMEDDHYIMFIEVLTKNKVLRKELHPGEKPQANFCCLSKKDVLAVREYCNKHGLWKA